MRLTGRAVAGWDTAVLRWCTDNRDPSAVRWDPALARRCGLDVHQLPELVRPASVVGTVLPEVAADLRAARRGAGRRRNRRHDGRGGGRRRDE